METVLKAIADWIKGILTAGIMSNLSGLFDDVNTQVGNIAQQVGTKPSSFEPRVFAMIEALSRNVVLPIAGIINHNLVYRVQEDGTCTNHVNSPKTKAGIRIIPMIDEVFDAFLEEYQYQKVIGFCTDEIDGYSGFVFCTGDGKVYLPNAINRTIRSICADYNKEEESKAKEENRDPVLLPKFSCHILRHTFCTRFCENETNLKVIQEIMGHADISTTMDVYAEATQEKKKESMTSLQSALLVR